MHKIVMTWICLLFLIAGNGFLLFFNISAVVLSFFVRFHMTAPSNLMINMWIIKETSGGKVQRHISKGEISHRWINGALNPQNSSEHFQANFIDWIWYAASLLEWVHSISVILKSWSTVYVLSLIITRFTPFILSPHHLLFHSLVILMLGFFHYAN